MSVSQLYRHPPVQGTNLNVESISGETGIFEQVTTTASFEPYVVRAKTPANPCGLTIYEDDIFTSSVGINSQSNLMYVYTVAPNRNIGFFTEGLERLTISSNGIVNDDTNTNILTIDGTTLKYRTVGSLPSTGSTGPTGNANVTIPTINNNVVIANGTGGQLVTSSINIDNVIDKTSSQTLTNKTISASNNTILVPITSFGDTNITDVIDQKLLSNVAVNFGSVNTIASVIAGVNVEGIRGIFNEISDTSGTNTTTVNGVNPLTTANTLANNVNQDLRTTANPTFNSLSITEGISTWNNKVQEFYGTFSSTAGFSSTTVYTLTMVPSSCYMVRWSLIGIVTSGGLTGTGFNQETLSAFASDSSGILTTQNTFYQNSTAANSIGTSQGIDVVDGTVTFFVADDVVNALNWSWIINIYVL